jgi:hypothetical protein
MAAMYPGSRKHYGARQRRCCSVSSCGSDAGRSCRFLQKTIQAGSHDSVEDARVAMELVRLKLKHGADFGTPGTRSLRTGVRLSTVLARHGHRACIVDRVHTVRKHVAGEASGVSVDSDACAVRHLL